MKLVQNENLFRLHSHEINYGSGSGQQSVTAHGSRDDPNSYWMVKEAQDDPRACVLGTKIECGATIRLEHIATRRNLHTHEFRSPISNNYEVSGFGVAGDGDAGDSWIVECEQAQQCDAKTQNCDNDEFWKRYALVRLKNFQMGTYLRADFRHRFDDSNCPHCPINGQLEVSASKKATDQTWWFAAEGIFISPLTQ